MSDQHATEVDHEENCAACGVYPRVEGSRHCDGCHEALRADGGSASGTRQFEVACRDGQGAPVTVEVEAKEEGEAKRLAKSQDNVESVVPGHFSVVPFRRLDTGEKVYGGDDA